MKNSETILDIAILPEMARIEILDFYDFLKQKYGAASEKFCGDDQKTKVLGKFLKNKIKVGKIQRFKREELHER